MCRPEVVQIVGSWAPMRRPTLVVFISKSLIYSWVLSAVSARLIELLREISKASFQIQHIVLMKKKERSARRDDKAKETFHNLFSTWIIIIFFFFT